MTDSTTLAQLVRQARDPSASLHQQHAAFTALVHRTQPIVFGLALASLCNVEDARDAAQDAYGTAWRRLGQLRDPDAVLPWLRTIVATACARKRRQRREVALESAVEPAVEPTDHALDYQAMIGAALDRLSRAEREVTVLFYFLGLSMSQVGALLQLKPGTVGKRLHSARLRIRRGLPRSVRADFVRLAPTKQFVERLRRGLLDEYIGEYRFATRPDLVVRISREGDSLISSSNGQRHVLVSGEAEALLTSTYDGEGRFQRNRRGRITEFVYYEFGRRMGIASKVSV